MLPAGNVTFLFTDIEGSTQHWEHHPDAMKLALEHHDALLHAIIEGHRGYVFKTVGDAFCAAFADAWDATAAAVEIQRAVAAEDWAAFGRAFPRLAVRIGLHTGTAESRAGDYFGPTVNRTARLEAAGNGGQILISEATRLLVDDSLPADYRLRDWGLHRLKDLRHAEHIYQLVAPDLVEVARPLRTVASLEPRDRVIVADVSADVPADAAALAARSAAPTADVRALLDATLDAVRRSDAVVVLGPDHVRALARHRPRDLTEYRLVRVAEWSQPRYRLDDRFVALTLMLDQGETAVAGRWAASDHRFGALRDVLERVPDPALVLLGPPGGGKSTLLRQIELDTAIRGLRGEEPGDRVTFFIQLNQYRSETPDADPPPPGRWLAERWHARFPDLPTLDALAAEGRLTLLVDGLNEMPLAREADFRARVGAWKAWLNRFAGETRGNRVVFTCRSLDYSAPLSTPALRVPQVRIEPMSDPQVHDFLKVHSPHRWREAWAALEASPQLDVLRSPYFLRLLVDHLEDTGSVPAGPAALFTGLVRHALRREVERDHPLFVAGNLLDTRDVQRITKWQWRTPWDLPDRGALVDGLTNLAYAMQADHGGGHVRVDVDVAEALVGGPDAAAVVRGGGALGLLDEDPGTADVMFAHQLVQEYFAARRLAARPELDRVAAAWRAADVVQTVAETRARLAPADPLPELPATGWEESTVLAAAMAADAGTFVDAVAEVNLALAARTAARPDVRDRLGADRLDALRGALIDRTRDPEADLRARIAAGHALGALGDPRFERRGGEHGVCALPPCAEIPGGTYPIGPDPEDPAAAPHAVVVAPFRIGRFAVTNAEYALFVAAGGYDEPRWWDSPTAERWRRGELTAEGSRMAWRYWRGRFRDDPGLIRAMRDDGRLTAAQAEEWGEVIRLADGAFDALLLERFVDGRRTCPRYWHDADYNSPAQPVVGVSWFEARAYCAWLAAASGQPFRLPTEVEWEAAARGAAGRAYAYGDTLDPERCNIFATQVRRPAPVGVFPQGDTPEGVCDLTGNTQDWTLSRHVPYPYAAGDGRDDPEPGDVPRVVRGGAFYGSPETVRATYRFPFNPLYRRLRSTGFRVCAAG